MHYTHYDYLEIAPGATPAAVDAAYTRLLEACDRGSRDHPSAQEARLRCIHAAYELLSNPVARVAYDARLAQEAAIADAELKSALDRCALRPAKHAQAIPEALVAAMAAIAA